MIKVTTKKKKPIVLAPKMFNKMICLPHENKTLHLAYVDAFLASQAGSSNFLEEFLLPSTNIPTNLSTINITFLQEPYWYYGCSPVLLAMSRLHKYVGKLYMHFTFHFTRIPYLIR